MPHLNKRQPQMKRYNKAYAQESIVEKVSVAHAIIFTGNKKYSGELTIFRYVDPWFPPMLCSRGSDFFFNQVGRDGKGIREGNGRKRVHGVLRLFLLKNYSIIKFLNRLEIIRSDGGFGGWLFSLPLLRWRLENNVGKNESFAITNIYLIIH